MKRVAESPGEIEATIGAIRGEGERRFAIAYPIDRSIVDGREITFSLCDQVWKGEHDPAHGQVVVLGEIVLFAKGWRAQNARPVQL